MSTPCVIGIINLDKSVDLISCHWDGYPSYQTPILLKSYNTEQKVRELLSLGEISELHNNIHPTTASHSFDTPDKDVVVSYHRDRGDKWEDCKPFHIANKSKVISFCGGGYIYLFDCERKVWTYTTNVRFKDFTEPVKDKK